MFKVFFKKWEGKRVGKRVSTHSRTPLSPSSRKISNHQPRSDFAQPGLRLQGWRFFQTPQSFLGVHTVPIRWSTLCCTCSRAMKLLQQKKQPVSCWTKMAVGCVYAADHGSWNENRDFKIDRTHAKNGLCHRAYVYILGALTAAVQQIQMIARCNSMS